MAMAAVLLSTLALDGCRKSVTAPSPSLDLPGPVQDLIAIRGDNTVWLTWKMPGRTTDKRQIKQEITVQLCRRDSLADICAAAGDPFVLAPGAAGSFTELLPAAQSSGPPRALYYFVELKNRNGKSAGLINVVDTLAGAHPSPVFGLTAESEHDGILLRWTPAKPGEEPDIIRLYRSPLPSEPAEQNSLVHPNLPGAKPSFDVSGAAGHAIDENIRNGESYEYRAQRVARVIVNGQVLELAGMLSPPVRVHAMNAFPASKNH